MKKHRILSAVLAAVLALSSLPMAISADTPAPVDEIPVPITSATKVTADATKGDRYFHLYDRKANAGLFHVILGGTLQKDTVYTLSMDVRNPSGSAQDVRVILRKADNIAIVDTNSTGNFKIAANDTEWHTVTLDFTPKDNFSGAYIRIQTSAAAQSQPLDFDNIKIAPKAGGTAACDLTFEEDADDIGSVSLVQPGTTNKPVAAYIIEDNKDYYKITTRTLTLDFSNDPIELEEAYWMLTGEVRYSAYAAEEKTVNASVIVTFEGGQPEKIGTATATIVKGTNGYGNLFDEFETREILADATNNKITKIEFELDADVAIDLRDVRLVKTDTPVDAPKEEKKSIPNVGVIMLMLIKMKTPEVEEIFTGQDFNKFTEADDPLANGWSLYGKGIKVSYAVEEGNTYVAVTDRTGNTLRPVFQLVGADGNPVIAEAGKTYELSFKIRTTKECSGYRGGLCFDNNGATIQYLYPTASPLKLSAANKWITLTTTFTVAEANVGKTLCFTLFGGTIATELQDFHLDDISIKVVG